MKTNLNDIIDCLLSSRWKCIAMILILWLAALIISINDDKCCKVVLITIVKIDDKIVMYSTPGERLDYVDKMFWCMPVNIKY